MNVRLDEFLVVSRASYIFDTMQEKNREYISSLDGTTRSVSSLSLIVPKSKHGIGAMAQEKTIYEMTKNFIFMLESLVEGLTVDKYVLCRPNKDMENVFVANYVHKRVDNNELIDVKIPFMFTETDIVAVSVFNSPELKERFNSPNQYIIGLVPTADLYKLDGSNKLNLLKYLECANESGVKNSTNILSKLDAIATSIHMQCELLLKEMSVVQNNGFNTLSDESKEFEKIYEKYSNSLDIVGDGDISLTDYMPIIIKEGDVNKALISKTTDNGKQITRTITGIESFDEVNKLHGVVTKEVLVKCPEGNIPYIIKLESTLYYVGYNTVVKESGNSLDSFTLIDPDTAFIPDEYVPSLSDDMGIESEAVREMSNKAKANILLPLKRFGITSGSKIYQQFFDLLKLPTNVAKHMFGTAVGVLKTSSKLEKEEAEHVQEQLLNDELDVTFTKIEASLQKYALLIGTSILLANFWIGLIVWFITKSRIDKVKIRAFERVERRLVSNIKLYEKKIHHAENEGDHKAVKALTQTQDTYKSMLDKLREVKSESLGKNEKYKNTISEYNDD